MTTVYVTTVYALHVFVACLSLISLKWRNEHLADISGLRLQWPKSLCFPALCVLHVTRGMSNIFFLFCYLWPRRPLLPPGQMTLLSRCHFWEILNMTMSTITPTYGRLVSHTSSTTVLLPLPLASSFHKAAPASPLVRSRRRGGGEGGFLPTS